jgi:hypothetical protein
MFHFAPRGLNEEIIPTEWVGIYQTATLRNDVAVGQFGEHVVSGAGPLPILEWTFTSTGGERELWIQYAALESRSLQIVVNGEQRAKHAAWEPTGGWKLSDQTYSYQCKVNLLDGENIIRIQGNGSIPNIRVVSICFLSDEKMDVDSRFIALRNLAEADQGAYTNLVCSDVADLNTFIQKMKARGLSSSSIKNIFDAYIDAHHRVQNEIDLLNGFGGPFNGERLRLCIVNDVMEAVSFSAFIETGAYLGTTTEHFARTGMPVLSCEAVLSNFLISALRLNRYNNAELFLLDSRRFMSQTLKSHASSYARPLFYLDAHWYDDLPLPEELNFIFANVDEYFVVVDDFEVPGSKYFYDTYSNGNELTFKFLMPKLDLSTKPVLMVPANASTEETGPRKGTLFIAPRKLYEERLSHIGRLKVIDPTPWL